MNLTDNEIIKALECCGESKQIGCTHCPVSEDCMNGRLDICTLTLDLINRKTAEIEEAIKRITFLRMDVKKYKAEIERLQGSIMAGAEVVRAVEQKLKTAKFEAIKEFAERLIHEIVNRPSEIQSTSVEYLHGSAYRQNEIVDLVKEMVGK